MMNSTPPGALASPESYNPFDLVNPFPFYLKARQETPIFYDEKLGYWVVTRYADVKRAMRELTTFSAEITGKPLRQHSAEVKRILDQGGLVNYSGLSMRMPPDHTRIRSFLNKAFTPTRIASLEGPVRERVRSMLEAFRLGRADIVRGLTYDLPALVIFILLGVPDEDVPRVKKWGTSRTALTWGDHSEERRIELAHDMVDYWQYCRDLVALRFEKKGDDLPSDLVRIYEAGDDSITRDEMASVLYSMLFAGHETTSNVLAEGIKILLAHREAWSTLCADRNLIPNAVEEMLRTCPAIVTWRRLVKRPTTLGGVDLPEGAHLLLVLGSANRDETHFDHGEDFDLRRQNAQEHVTFGHGAKYCLGAPLARLEIRVVLEELTQQFPSMRLVQPQAFEYASNAAFRGPRAVWVEWDEKAS